MLVACLAFVHPAWAGDPRRVWKTIETEHFVIHYYVPLDDVARRVAEVAEYSHRVLSPVMGHAPTEKTQVVITDDTDSANGFALALPRNAIHLFATVPDSLSELNDHDDWLYGLTVHEYTHVLHLDSIGGLPRLYNRVFGKLWSPNQVSPRWIIEGIATYQESQRSSSGRTRNAIFDMNLRAVTLDDQRIDLDAVTNGPRAWPRGNAAYLYGSYFLKYIFDRYGEDKLRALSWSYGSNPFPYSLNRTIQEITGETFDALYKDWLDYMRDRYSLQLEAVERAGLREGRRLTFSAENNVIPLYHGSELLWLQSDGYSEPRLRAMPVASNIGQARDYATIQRMSSYDILADGSLVVSLPTTYRAVYSFGDLYRWDCQSQELQRLTRAARASEPAISPDERQVAFVKNGRAHNMVAVMDIAPYARQRVVWRGERFDEVDTPYWSPDGKSIAFSLWSKGGYRDIAVVDVKTGAWRRLWHDRASDVTPVFSPDGAYLYYASDRTGIYNIYALELAGGKIWQVSNVRGGAFWPSVSGDGKRLAYQGFGVGGYDLYELDIEPERWLEPLPVIDDRPDPVNIPRGEITISAPRPYRPLATLAPQYYLLALQTSSFGSALDIQTDGADAVGIHSYTLGATIGLERRDVNIAGSYAYQGLWPSLRLAAARTASSRGGLFLDGISTRYTLDVYSVTASVGLPVLDSNTGSGRLSLQYDLDWMVDAEDQVGEYDPNDQLPRYPEVDLAIAGLALSWSYGNSRSYVYSAGPQRGQFLTASLRLDHPALGSDVRSIDLRYTWNGFRKLPWGHTASLSLRLAGGIRASDRQQAGLFGLGGVPEQDLATAILQNVRTSFTGYLRGYPLRSVVGSKFQLANLEYRQVLWEIEKGVSTLPVYLRRLHLAGLFDAGSAWNDELAVQDIKAGLGAALRLDTILGYFVSGSLEIGYARGLTGDGINEYWTLLTGTL